MWYFYSPIIDHLKVSWFLYFDFSERKRKETISDSIQLAHDLDGYCKLFKRLSSLTIVTDDGQFHLIFARLLLSLLLLLLILNELSSKKRAKCYEVLTWLKKWNNENKEFQENILDIMNAKRVYFSSHSTFFSDLFVYVHYKYILNVLINSVQLVGYLIKRNCRY